MLLSDMLVAASATTARAKRFDINEHEDETLYASIALLLALSGPGRSPSIRRSAFARSIVPGCDIFRSLVRWAVPRSCFRNERMIDIRDERPHDWNSSSKSFRLPSASRLRRSS